MLIYKVLTATQWADFREAKRFDGAPVDLDDGYIHFSTAAQTAETLAKHFAGMGGLVLAAVHKDRLGEALRWEPSRGGALFPHLYRALMLDEVTKTYCLHLGEDGSHQLPAAVTEQSP